MPLDMEEAEVVCIMMIGVGICNVPADLERISSRKVIIVIVICRLQLEKSIWMKTIVGINVVSHLL